MNPTIHKFGYPASLVREYDHWVVLLRPAQVTLGSLVLAAKSDAPAYSALPPEAFAEQAPSSWPISKQALQRSAPIEKINYLMLMMVDREVHFHVIPRYSRIRGTSTEPTFPTMAGRAARARQGRLRRRPIKRIEFASV